VGESFRIGVSQGTGDLTMIDFEDGVQPGGFHVKQSELELALERYLVQMAIVLESRQIALLARHIRLVLDANKRVNLTRVTDPLQAVRLHTADSLAVLEDLARANAGPLLDLGSGAGFPGIPIAVTTNRPVLLVDSVAKKVRELDAIVSSLGLLDCVSTSSSRAEVLGRTMRGKFPVVVARAVSELPALVELASPLLAMDGRLYCLKGSPTQEETTRGQAAADLVGMVHMYEREFELPEGAGHRTILCYRKSGKSSVALPRREGLAQNSPLA
jgi:16S rRNA (guanine527-N7)-methyltransferase